jgi:hypothetical protein
MNAPVLCLEINASLLREQLMAPDPHQRVLALFALERKALEPSAWKNEKMMYKVEQFTLRGLPFYAPQDKNYKAWVNKAVELWEKLGMAPQKGAVNSVVKSVACMQVQSGK